MMDSQMVELLGKNHLINELLRAGVEVAEPARDRGVDLIIYDDLKSPFRAIPIQLKAFTKEGLSIDKKYSKFPGMIIAYVWNVQTTESITYALTYEECLDVAEQMGWTKTASLKNGKYSTTKPSARLKELLEPYKMNSEKWKQKISRNLGDRI